jgi:hypothetical protein
MRAKQVYEFEQGGDPYKTMGLGSLQVGDNVRFTEALRWTGSYWEPSNSELTAREDLTTTTWRITHIDVTHRHFWTHEPNDTPEKMKLFRSGGIGMKSTNSNYTGLSKTWIDNSAIKYLERV